MFKDYTNDQYTDLRKIHNILCLVGNGFDVGLINHLNKINGSHNKTTSFTDFYDYLNNKHKSFDNVIYNKMTEDRANNIENWSDFEFSVQNMLIEQQFPKDDILQSLYQISNEFALYLYGLVTPELLIAVNNLSMTNKLAINSMGKFIKDLKQRDEINFPKNTYHYHLYNYLFVNFNYTMLLDDYIYLDTKQFDPHVYKGVDRNFDFYPEIVPLNPDNETFWSSYLMSDVIHPHGVQSIPRSIIFGADMPSYRPYDKEKFLNKPFIAQNDYKYFDLFDKTELFIIYGMSLGVTDSWWFDNIFDALTRKDDPAELIIYWHTKSQINDDVIKEKFLSSCVRHEKILHMDAITDSIKERIFVVQFSENNTNYLGFNNFSAN